jgi:hypothetical protein
VVERRNTFVQNKNFNGFNNNWYVCPGYVNRMLNTLLTGLPLAEPVVVSNNYRALVEMKQKEGVETNESLC